MLRSHKLLPRRPVARTNFNEWLGHRTCDLSVACASRFPHLERSRSSFNLYGGTRNCGLGSRLAWAWRSVTAVDEPTMFVGYSHCAGDNCAAVFSYPPPFCRFRLLFSMACFRVHLATECLASRICLHIKVRGTVVIWLSTHNCPLGRASSANSTLAPPPQLFSPPTCYDLELTFLARFRRFTRLSKRVDVMCWLQTDELLLSGTAAVLAATAPQFPSFPPILSSVNPSPRAPSRWRCTWFFVPVWPRNAAKRPALSL